jgi:Phage integrase family
LRVRDMQSRQGVMHFRVKGKPRQNPVRSRACDGTAPPRGIPGPRRPRRRCRQPLFRPVTNNRTKELEKPLNPNSIYRNILLKYGLETGVSAEVNGLCVHSLRATAATNALSHEADIAKVQEWLGHANVSTTRLYDRRKTRPENSPTFRVIQQFAASRENEWDQVVELKPFRKRVAQLIDLPQPSNVTRSAGSERCYVTAGCCVHLTGQCSAAVATKLLARRVVRAALCALHLRFLHVKRTPERDLCLPLSNPCAVCRC